MSHRSRVGRFAYTVLFVVVWSCDREAPTGAAPADSLAPNGNLTGVLLAGGMLGGPLAGLTPGQLALFTRGSGEFQRVFTPETGLGPLFNAVGCAACHEEPLVGGGGSNDPEEEGEDIEVHATAFHAGAKCDNLDAVGGQVIQKQVTPELAALGIGPEPVPPEATLPTALRTTPDLFGFGLLDAVPDQEILAFADPTDRNGDGISGRAHRLPNGRIGRFGRKAQEATLTEFNTGAFVMEMGVTNPGLLTEQTIHGTPLPDGVDLVVPEPELTQSEFDAADAFVHFLAPPPRQPLNLVGQAGGVIFVGIGCASCHVPALVTGPSPVRALSLRIFQPYTDLLLHDMGPGLADICLGDALPSEFRTEPLMGLRFATAFLHDGRASTIGQAIRLHGGEASRARDRFLRLSPGQHFALLTFLRSL
jgi:CxxC motif-containing protein (DUF1111 family)